MRNIKKSRLSVFACLLVALLALTAILALNIFADSETKLTGTAITLTDGTNIRFGGTLAEADREGATLDYTVADRSGSIPLTADADGNFIADVPIGADEMALTVTAKIIVGGAEKDTMTQSVKNYAATLLADDSVAVDTVKLVVSEMLRYGDEAYKYTHSGTSSDLLQGLTLFDALTFPQDPVYTYQKGTAPDPVTDTFKSIRLTLTDNLRLNLTTTGGETVRKIVKISQFFDGFTATAEGAASVTASPSLYVHLNKNDSTVGNLVKTLYNYAVAVHMIIGNHTCDREVAAFAFLKDNATCESAAVYYKSCLCGEVSEETFTFGEAVDHVFTDETDLTNKKTDATCQSPAVYYKTCAWCDEKGGEDDVFTSGDPLDHTLTQEVVQPRYLASAATCQAAATYYKSCSVCGAFDENAQTFTSGDKAPHAYTEEVSEADYLKDEATCTSAAVYYLSCACGEKGGEENTFTFGDPLDHTYTEEVVHEDYLAQPADCDSAALYHKSCACGAFDENGETFENGDALGHSYDSGSTTEADCENAERTRYSCTECDHFYEDIGTAAKGHNLTGAQLLREDRIGDSCDYTQIYRCMTCGEEAAGATVTKHTHIATVTTPATCQADGVMTYTCACTDTYTAPIAKNESAHQWVGVEGSTTSFACSVQGCNATKTVVDASGDTSANVSKDTLADASLQLKDAEIKLDPDILQNDDVAGADELTISATTTTKDNLPAGVELTEFQKQQIGDSLIYDFTMKNGENAISDFDGKFVTITIPYTLAPDEDVDSIFVWFINDQGEVEAIAATYNVVDGEGYVSFQTSHFSLYSVTRLTDEEQCEFYNEHVESTMTVKATCSAGGYTLHTCSRCGYTYKTNETPALGHNYLEDAEASADATCQSGGHTVMVCDREGCSDTYTITHTKLAHTYADGVVTAPTCEDRGYTTHTCTACSHSYRDSYVAALRHDYAHEWTWNNDNTQAGVTFTCQNDDDHTTTLTASVRTRQDVATCQKDGFTSVVASVSFGGRTYTDSKTEVIPKLAHAYIYLLYNKDEHWHACLCGEVATDDQGNQIRESHECTETILSSATCQKAGEKLLTCACGYTTTAAVAKLDHTYAGGVCTMCGSEEEVAVVCDHALTETVIFDLTPFGCCQASFTYKSCLCGEVKVADMEDMQTFICFGKGESNMVVDPTNPMHFVLTCPDCHFTLDLWTVKEDNGCHMYMSCTMNLRANGEVIVEDLFAEMETEEHGNQSTVDIDLSTLSSCGGTIRASRCGDCGKYTYLSSMEPGCRDMTSAQNVVIIDGVPHMIQTMTCNAAGCGLMFKMDMWEENQGPCTSVQHTIVSVYDEGVLQYAIERSEYQNNHEFEYEATFHDPSNPTCIAGVSWRAVCRICETVRSGDNNHHQSKEEQVNFGSDVCGGTMRINRCTLCHQVTYADMYSLACHWTSTGTQPSPDGSQVDVMYCMQCGLHRTSVKTFNTALSHDCLLVYDVSVTFVMGEKEVFTYETTEQRSEHAWEYDFHFQNPDMPNCEDGYTYDAVCTLCGETMSNYNTQTHHMDHNRIEETFRADGYLCGGVNVHVSKCIACGTVESQWVNFNCPYTTQTTTYTDDLGEHTVHTKTCPNCLYTVTEDSVLRSVDGCVSYYQVAISVTQGDEHRISYEYVRKEDNHDMVQGEVIGDCTAGWKRTDTCRLCGHTEEQSGQGHKYEKQRTDLSGYTTCGGYVYREVCQFCGQVNEAMFEYSFPCPTGMREDERTYTDNSGLVHTTWRQTCRECGLVFVYDRYEIDNPGMIYSCYVYMYETITLYRNDTAVISFQRRQDEAHHVYIDDYMLYDASLGCEGGWSRTRTCENCPYEEGEMQGTGHADCLTQSIDLRDLGACGGKIHVYACDVCDTFLYINRFDIACTMSQENIDYVNDLQKHIHGYRDTCTTCHFTYEDVYYAEPTEHSCKTNEYHTIRATFDGRELLCFEYVSLQENHTYVAGNIRYMDADSSSCLQGIYITYTCACGESYESQAHHHELTAGWQIPLSDYGSTCGGYILRQECICGEVKRMEMHGDCDFQKESYDLTFSTAIDPNAPGIQLNDQLPYHLTGSSLWLNTYTELWTCAADNCGFTVIYATFWDYDEETCKAYEQEVYMLNYNTEDGTSRNNQFNQTGNWQYYHEYAVTTVTDETTGKETRLTYTCKHCGSIYQKDTVYGEGEQIESVTHSFDNRIHGELPYYIQSTVTYKNGYEQWSTTYINVKSETHTYTTTHTVEAYHDIPDVFGDEATARQHTVTTQLDGVDYHIERWVEVMYREHTYTLLRYQNDCCNGYWSQDSYEYSFSPTCQFRITFTNSNGFTRVDAWQSACMQRYYIAEQSHDPTCSQDGVWVYGCPVCGNETDQSTEAARGHDFIAVTGEDGSVSHYVCTHCALESDTGINGSMILEDMSDEENYIVGYYAGNAGYTSYTMALQLSANGGDAIQISDAVTVYHGQTGERKLVFSKATIDAIIDQTEGSENGYKLFLQTVGFDADGTPAFSYYITLAQVSASAE